MIKHPPADRISAFLGGDLPERDLAGVRHHLTGCSDCAKMAEELGAWASAAAALPRPEPPVTMWSAIEGTLARQEPARFLGGAGTWSWRSWLVGAAAGAAVVGGAGGMTWRIAERGARDRRVAAESEVAAEASRIAAPPSGPVDPLLLEAENELGRAASAYEQAAARLRALLEREQGRWAPAQRARVAERLAGLDDAVAHCQAVVRRDPGDGAGAEMLFAAYQQQIAFLAEAVHRGSPSLAEGMP